MPIPKIIHQIWMNPAEDGTKTCPPVDIQQYMAEWQNCGYEYRLWDGESMADHVRQQAPEFYDTYIRYDSWIKRCDAFRYIILYQMGGFYIDADTQKLGKLDELCRQPAILLQSSGIDIQWELKLSNCFMAASRYHPFFKFCMERLECSRDVCLVFAATGPDFLTNAYDQYPNKSKISIINEDKLPINHMASKSWVTAQADLIVSKYFIYFIIIIIITIIVILLVIVAIRWPKIQCLKQHYYSQAMRE